MNPVPTDTSLAWAGVTASQESRKHDSHARGWRDTAALSITVIRLSVWEVMGNRQTQATKVPFLCEAQVT